MLRLVVGVMILSGLLGGRVEAQQAGDLRALHEKKLVEPFLHQGHHWYLDYDRARDSARTMRKFGDVMIFAYFTRSYAP